MDPFNKKYKDSKKQEEIKSNKELGIEEEPIRDIQSFIANQNIDGASPQTLSKIIEFYEGKINKYKQEIRVLKGKKDNEVKQIKPVQIENEVIEDKEIAILKDNELKIRLWYEAQRKWLSSIPKDADELRQLIISMVISSKKTPLTDDDFRMYFYDYESEKCLIETDSDLECALSMAEKATPPHLKLCLDIRRGINSADSDEENKSNRKKVEYNCKKYQEESDGEDDIEKLVNFK